MTTKHDYNRELASALVSAAVAIRSLRDEMSRQGIPESDAYSFEMGTIMDMTKRIGPDETTKFLRDSFEAGSYDEVFRMQMSAPEPMPFSVSAWDGSYYQFDSIDEAVSYFFILPEDTPHYLTYDTVISGTERRLYLLEAKDRHVEVSSLDRLVKNIPKIKELHEHVENLAEQYISPDTVYTGYGLGRFLTVGKCPQGYEYGLSVSGNTVISGIYACTWLSTRAAVSKIHEMIFERGLMPDTRLPFARVNSKEFINILGLPPYEGSQFVPENPDYKDLPVLPSRREKEAYDRWTEKIPPEPVPISDKAHVISDIVVTNTENSIDSAGDIQQDSEEQVHTKDHSQEADVDYDSPAQEAVSIDGEKAEIDLLALETSYLLIPESDYEYREPFTDGIKDTLKDWDGKDNSGMRSGIEKIYKETESKPLSYRHLKAAELLSQLDIMTARSLRNLALTGDRQPEPEGTERTLPDGIRPETAQSKSTLPNVTRQNAGRNPDMVSIDTAPTSVLSVSGRDNAPQKTTSRRR